MTERGQTPNLWPSIDVQWSPEQAAFVARSPRCPGLTGSDRWSALAAVDALIEAAGAEALGYKRSDSHTPSVDNPRA